MNKKFRLYLRALELEDYKTSIAWRKNDDIWNSVVGRKYFVSEEYERQWVKDKINGKPGSEVLAVCLFNQNEYIGNAYLNNIDFFNRNCESARLIGSVSHQGCGYGTEISLLLLKHAFHDLGLERVSSKQLTNNLGSIKSLEKVGYKMEGIARKAVMKNGALVDLNLMACLREDFEIAWNKFMNDQ